MKAVFSHDHCFISDGTKVYSKGGLPKTALDRYVRAFGNINVICRMLKVDTLNNDYAIASGNGISFSPFYNIRSLKGLFFIPRVYFGISKVIQDKDVVIVRLPSSLGALTYFSAKNKNKLIIVEVVGNALEANRLHGNKLGKLFGTLDHYITKKVILNADHVIYITKEYLQSTYPNIKNQYVCSNAAVTPIKKQDLAQRLSKLKLTNNKIVIGLIGSLDVEYKGHKVAIEAVSQALKFNPSFSISLQFVGSGNKDKWEKLADSCGISEHVTFIGSLTGGEAVFNWIDSLDIMLQPSLVEAQGRSIIEGLSRGCPVIASNVGGIVELLDEWYLCPPTDSSIISEKIIHLINNKEQLIENSLRNWNFSKQFSSSVLDDKRSDIFSSITKNMSCK